MKITDIRIEQFGDLQALELTGLSPGLNVVFVPEESGATTLVRFLRRMLFGLDDVPPGDRASAGRLGAVTVEHAAASYRLVRSDRGGHPETFAICVRGSESAATEAVRATLASADRRLVEHICLVTAAERDRPDELRALAGILAQQSHFTGPAAQHIESRPDGQAVASLAQRCEQLRLEIFARVRSESRRQQEFNAQIRRMDDRRRGIEDHVSWLDAELQAAVSDLREVEDRLWVPTAEPEAPDQRPADSAAGETGGDVEHLRRVICDLAERRLRLSRMLAAGAAGIASAADTASSSERSHAIRLENERLRIDRCEAELLHQLRCLEHTRADEGGRSDCVRQARPVPPPVRDEKLLRAHLEALRMRCRELRRQLEAACVRLRELQSERQRLDVERRRSAAERTLDAQLYELSVLEQQLVSAELQQRATALLDRVCQRLQAPLETMEFIREQASAILMQITGAAPCGPQDASQPVQLTARDSVADDRPDTWPHGGSREQSALALRLALLTAAARSGSELPVVWDDALTETDPERIRAAGRLLAEFARHGRQLILLTGRERVAALLAECGATVHQPVRTGAPAAESEATTPQFSDDSPCEPDPAAAPLVRIHPAEPHWLRADSSLNELPSLGTQMARQLRRMGLLDVGDLIALDLSKCTFLLSESRLTAEQVRLWQVEAELLCCVPDLTGRDAQLLVSCGLLTPAELAAANVDELVVRIDRLRGGETTRWLPYVGVWPRAGTVRSWIQAARHARPLAMVFAAAAGRAPRRWPGRIEREAMRLAGTSAAGEPPERPARPDIRLRPDGPVVDAPSIGPRTARLLERIGIVTIGNLLACDAEATARRLRHPRITAEVLVTWQRQSALMCSLPGLRCGDAQVLVACGIHQPADLRRISASALSAIVGPYVKSEEGRRLLRSASPPTADDVARWVEAAQDDAILRAA
jgi:hypothetical protein